MARWEKEFNENAGKSTPWPSTQAIDDWAKRLRFAKMFLPVLGGAFFLIALFTQPKAKKDESPFGSSALPTPATLLSPSATASTKAGKPTPAAATAAGAGKGEIILLPSDRLRHSLPEASDSNSFLQIFLTNTPLDTYWGNIDEFLQSPTPTPGPQ